MATVSPSGNTTAAVTYTPIATNTLSSATSTVTFSSITGTYKDLVLIINGGTSVNDSFANLTFNSDSGSNYSITRLVGNGTTASSGRSSNQTRIFIGYDAAPNTAFQFNSIVNKMNYSNTTTYKTVLTRDNSPAGTSYPGAAANVGLWRSTSAITTITLISNTSNFISGSTFSLYGIGA